MTPMRALECKHLLEQRRDAIDAQVRDKIRTIRQAQALDGPRAQVEASDDLIDEDIAFALVRVQGEILDKIKAALKRLDAGEYGVCDECSEDIEEKRLRAVPFAIRCRSCQESAERFRRHKRWRGTEYGERQEWRFSES